MKNLITVTPYLILSGIMYLYLSFHTIRLRYKYKIAIHANGNQKLNYATRAHANFAEYVPLAFIFLITTTLLGWGSSYINLIGTLLILGRISHASGILYFEQLEKPKYIARQVGMMLTFSSIIFSIILLTISFVRTLP